MPIIVRTDGEHATPTVNVFAESSSEAAALPNGQKALTPIIAGTISGTCVGVAWLIALVAALVKRHKRKKKYKKVGRPDLVDEHPKPDVFIVPPDPAVVQGQYKPGERVIVTKDKKHKHKRGNGKGKEKASRMDEQGLNVEDEEIGSMAVEEEQRVARDKWKGRPPRRPETFTRMTTIWSTSGSRQASTENVDRGYPRSQAQGPRSENAELSQGDARDNSDNRPERGQRQTPKAEDYAYGQDPQTRQPTVLSDSGAHVHLYPPSRHR